ncbi:uncharacterized protein LOC141897975 isoform X2 [Acropora palmata]|uniref:uncharacterized protein LOC141897975 isoform X2 n=1 Tax=Acropora palmata TaxID=6131 RepID=UPI003D9FDF92
MAKALSATSHILWCTRLKCFMSSSTTRAFRSLRPMKDPDGEEKGIANQVRHFSSMYISGVFDRMQKDGLRVIDLRSDTVTKPTKGMRDAMAVAAVGDDVYGDDPTVNALQIKAAELTGKEAALFVASGTMGNLISVMAHCRGRGEEILVGDQSHIIIWEQGGVAQVAGVHPRQVHTNCDGTLDLADIANKVRSPCDAHQPVSCLICVEQTHNATGGRVLSLDYLQKLRKLATELGLKVHMDGARIFNAATALGVPVAHITQHVDSISFCLSKGLGAPVGSVVAGEEDFIARCLRHRKVLGGGMRQAGVLAAAGIYALDHIAPKLHQDHTNAQILAQGIQEMKNLGIEIDMETIDTNMVYFKVNNNKVSANDLVKSMFTVSDTDSMEKQVAVKMLTLGKNRIRLVLHHQVTEADIQNTLQKMRMILTS